MPTCHTLPSSVNPLAKFSFNLPLGKALQQKPNSAWSIVDTIESNAPVYESPVIDGYAGLMDNYPEENRFLVSEKLRNSTDMNRVSWTTKLERSWKDSIIKELKKSMIIL